MSICSTDLVEALGEFAAKAVTGVAQFVVVNGPARIGKTTLVEQFAAVLADAGWHSAPFDTEGSTVLLTPRYEPVVMVIDNIDFLNDVDIATAWDLAGRAVWAEPEHWAVLVIAVGRTVPTWLHGIATSLEVHDRRQPADASS